MKMHKSYTPGVSIYQHSGMYQNNR